MNKKKQKKYRRKNPEASVFLCVNEILNAMLKVDCKQLNCNEKDAGKDVTSLETDTNEKETAH